MDLPNYTDIALEKALGEYDKLDEDAFTINCKGHPVNLEINVLSPEQINNLLEIIISNSYHEKITSHHTGSYISDLIQESYDAGYNDFTLTTDDMMITELGSDLEGTNNNPIRITIEGGVGSHFGNSSKNVFYHIKGNTKKCCGANSENITLIVEGILGKSTGCYSNNMKLITPNKESYDNVANDEHSLIELKYSGSIVTSDIDDEQIKKTIIKYDKFQKTKKWSELLELGSLKPKQINTILDIIIDSTPNEIVQNKETGVFLSKLIQNSYEIGNNDFSIDVKDKKIEYFMSYLKGTKESSIQITLCGDAGISSGYKSKYIDLTVNNSDGNLGEKSSHSIFNCLNESNYGAGKESESSTFNINNTYSNIAEGAKKGTFNIEGTIKEYHSGLGVDPVGENSNSCTFNTTNKRTYDLINKSISFLHRFVEKKKINYTGNELV